MVDDANPADERPKRKERLRTPEARLRRKQARRGSQGLSPKAEGEKKPAVLERAPDMRSPRRINRIAEFIGAKSYLEIGVFKGLTFLAIDIPRKVAVDPKFRFDVEAHRSPGVDFYEMFSDDFFNQKKVSEKFDIIFVDGLHVFGQAWRDFENSLALSHDNTVWIIDDVVPMDEYSSIPDAQLSRKARREATGKRTGGWHGDVYKVVLGIHDLHPELSYVTASTNGNEQTIVWRAPRKKVKPIYGSLEAIDKADYAEFLNQQSAFNLQPEEEALATLFSAMTEVRRS